MKCLRCRKDLEKTGFYGLHRDCYLKWFKLTDVLEFTGLDPKTQDSSLNYPRIKKTTNSFFHGRYRKYSAELGSTAYILKVQEENFLDLPATEYICNSIASLLGLDVPDYYLIRYPVENNQKILHNKKLEQKKNNQEGSPEQTENKEQNIRQSEKWNHRGMAFVTRNFMQDYKGGTLDHIYKFLPKGEKNYNCKNIINVLFQKTKPADVARFIEIALFDSLIGNNDRHGRNLGIIESAKHRRLAPMYDNPSYFGIASSELIDADFNISGCIGTSNSDKPKFLDYIQEFQFLGFEKVCLNFLKKAVRQSPKIIEELKCSAISKRRKKAFIKFLNKQLRSMEGFCNV